MKSVKEKERERERVNTSYCWNAVATRGRKEGGGEVCMCAGVSGFYALFESLFVRDVLSSVLAT